MPSSPPLCAENAATRWVRRLAPAAILLTAVCAMTDNVVDTDLWGHVVYGREVLEQGKLHETTTWSYVVDDYRWINHEILAELLMAWSVSSFGVLGLTFGKFLLACLIVGAMIFSSRLRGAGWISIAVVVVVAADATEFHWHFRPQALSYTAFALMIALLTWVFRDWQGSWRPFREAWRGTPRDVPKGLTERFAWLLLLPVLMALWTNSHGGFAAGLAILTAYLGLRGFEAWCWWGRKASRVLLVLAGIVFLSALATLVNPYGIDLHLWMLESVGTPRPEISDWQPIDLLSDPEAVNLWMLLGLGAFSHGLSRKRRDMTHVVLLGLTLWQALAHCRHLVFFALLCGCWFAPHLHSAFSRVTKDFRERLAREGRSWEPGWGVNGALLGWMIAVTAVMLPRLKEIPVRRDWYPVSAMQFLKEQKLHGRVLVDFNWAQYAIMCFADDPNPSSRVAIDGRFRTCYPQDVLDIFMDFQLGDLDPSRRYRSPDSPPFDADRALEWGRADLVLLSREVRHAVQTMQSVQDEWILLYQDSLAQIWGRKAVYDDPSSPSFLPPSRRSLGDARQAGTVPWPALPKTSDLGSRQLAVQSR